MAFRRTVEQSVRVSKNSIAASAAAVPKSSPPVRPACRKLPAVDDCRTLSFLLPRPSTGRYSTVSVPLPPQRFPALPVGDHLFNRLRLDDLVPPETMGPSEVAGVTVEEATKVARAAALEAARARLRATAESCVSGSEFSRLCRDIAGGADGGRRLAWALDEAGVVIVLGDIVFLRPDMVAKAIESIIPSTRTQPSDAHKRELQKMEEQKAAIDTEARAQVRRELWCGLALVTLQTLGFMRLTFWELSWDVMEPVCFFVTSLYFISGYAFFMRTAKEPSFESLFQSRFTSRQRRLMQAHRFNAERYNVLKQEGGSISPLPGW